MKIAEYMINSEKVFSINTTTEKLQIKIPNIVMVKADGVYSMIYFDCGKKIMTSKTLKHWEMTFNSSLLVRVHQSYLVNKNMIADIDWNNGFMKMGENTIVNISRRKKQTILQHL